jgi:hypothetical protein
LKAAPVKISDEIVEGGCINIYPIDNVFSLLLNKNVAFTKNRDSFDAVITHHVNRGFMVLCSS